MRISSLCKILIKNINNGACRWAKGMPVTKGQQTSFGPGYNSPLMERINLFQILKRFFFLIAHAEAIIKKALVLVRCDKAIQRR